MTREHFRELSFITLGYHYPLIGMKAAQAAQAPGSASPDQGAKKKKVSSFFRMFDDNEQPAPSLSPTLTPQQRPLSMSTSGIRQSGISPIARRRSSMSLLVVPGTVPTSQEDEDLLNALEDIDAMYVSTGKLLECLDKKNGAVVTSTDHCRRVPF